MSKDDFALGAPESRRHTLPSPMVNRPILMVSAAAGFTVFAAVMFNLLDRPHLAAQSGRTEASLEPSPSKAADTSSQPDIQAPSRLLLAQALAEPIDTPAPALARTPALAPTLAPTLAPAPAVAPSLGLPPASPPAASRVAELASAPSTRLLAGETADVTGETRRAQKVAAIDPDEVKPRPSIASNPGAPTACLPVGLRAVLTDLAARFGPLTIVSTTHLHTENHSRGSTREKLHLACRAVDIKTSKEPREVMAYLRSRPEVGGVNIYQNRVIHFDVNANYKSTASNPVRARQQRAVFAVPSRRTRTQNRQ